MSAIGCMPSLRAFSPGAKGGTGGVGRQSSGADERQAEHRLRLPVPPDESTRWCRASGPRGGHVRCREPRTPATHNRHKPGSTAQRDGRAARSREVVRTTLKAAGEYGHLRGIGVRQSPPSPCSITKRFAVASTSTAMRSISRVAIARYSLSPLSLSLNSLRGTRLCPQSIGGCQLSSGEWRSLTQLE